MIEIYKENAQIVKFFQRAQNKIAELSTSIVERGGDSVDELLLLLELSDFVEELDSCTCEWEEKDILRWIHAYNYRADLNSIPLLDITGFNTQIITGESSSIFPIYVVDIVDFVTEVNKLIKATAHNSLANIQGGTITERYHVTKQMYDYLDNPLNPKIASTVSLVISTTPIAYPSGYFELGTVVSSVKLTGSIVYNTYKQAKYFNYTKDDLPIGLPFISPPANQQPLPFTDTTAIKQDTKYSFMAEFEEGIKKDSGYVRFKQPMYYGIMKANTIQLDSVARTGIKDVRDRGEMNLSFTLPAGNTLKGDDYLTPYLFIPASWGKFTFAINNTFDFSDGFSIKQIAMTLADGNKVDGLLLLYTTKIEGSTTFKFNW